MSSFTAEHEEHEQEQDVVPKKYLASVGEKCMCDTES